MPCPADTHAHRECSPHSMSAGLLAGGQLLGPVEAGQPLAVAGRAVRGQRQLARLAQPCRGLCEGVCLGGHAWLPQLAVALQPGPACVSSELLDPRAPAAGRMHAAASLHRAECWPAVVMLHRHLPAGAWLAHLSESIEELAAAMLGLPDVRECPAEPELLVCPASEPGQLQGGSCASAHVSSRRQGRKQR